VEEQLGLQAARVILLLQSTFCVLVSTQSGGISCQDQILLLVLML
jgi:hypothetical protein